VSVTGASESAQPPSSEGVPRERESGVMTVRVRLFAILREQAGVDHVELELHTGATVSDAVRALSELEPLGELLDRLPVHLAVNRDYATSQMTLGPDDELALIPPISGGSPELTMPDTQASMTGQQDRGQ
jgi:molybdopterin converting factor subunit 1